MNDNLFSLGNLIPKFSLIFTGHANSAEGISALFVLILISVFLGFLLFQVFLGRSNCLKKINFYFNLLDGVSREELVSKRRQLEQTAMEDPMHGRLWREFDESLVYSFDGNVLSNTIDAGHFFNTHSLARGITESRLLAAVPGFLTAIGVIGTFTGLQLGIGGLDLDTNNTEILKHGIATVVKGASIAFLTSVWGVFLSVTFNWIEKIVESKIRDKISSLQNRIDYLFPRINAEQSLVEISHSSKSSEETLLGLAEKIGNKMQEAVLQMAEGVQVGMENSLQKVLAPAIEQLVTASSDLAGRQAEGSQNALEDLIEKFMGKFGQEGERQQALMTDASKEVKAAMASWGQNMGDFLKRLESQLSEVEKENNNRQKALDGQIYNIASNQETMIGNVEKSIGKHVDATKQLLDQGQALEKGIINMQDNLTEVSKNMTTAGSEINEAATALQTATHQVNETNKTMATSITEATTSNIAIAEHNKDVAEQFKTLINNIDSLKSDYSNVTKLLNEAADNAEKTFNHLTSHQNSYQKVLKEHVGEMRVQLDAVLTNYQKQVEAQTQSRLSAWDEETIRYTNAMQGVVNVMQELVDDMDSKQ